MTIADSAVCILLLERLKYYLLIEALFHFGLSMRKLKNSMFSIFYFRLKIQKKIGADNLVSPLRMHYYFPKNK